MASQPEDQPEHRPDDQHHGASALLVVLSGPSGVGKDTVLQKMRDLGLPLAYAVTATTRPRRPGEVDGFHYHFLSEAEFMELKERGEFLEYAEVYGNWYGSLRQPIRAALAEGRDVILKIDVQGARSVMEQAPDALFLFLAPPNLDWLREKLRARKTETEEKLRAREAAAIGELESAHRFDHVIVNQENDVDEVVRQVMQHIAQERRDRPAVRP